MMWLLNDYTFQVVAAGAVLIGVIGGISGTYAVLRKQSLLGDCIAHTSLAGIAISYMMTQTKSTEVLLIGALITGLVTTFIINFFVKHTKVNYDSSLAIVITMFFGVGLMLLTQIQKSSDSNQSGLDRFLFGQTATLRLSDLYVSVVVLVIIVGVVMVCWKPLKVYTFNPEYAKTLGYNTSFINFILSAFVVSAVIIGIQMVGVVLMSSLLVAPAVASLQWSKSLKSMIIISGILGGLSGLGGTVISSLYDKIPTGPSIVILISMVVFISLLFAPHRGLIARRITRHKITNQLKELT